jgi:hypothetical protein
VLKRDTWHSHEFDALVDTGADYCSFPARWVGITDEEWETLPSLDLDTIKGDRTLRFAWMDVTIEKIGKVEIYAGLTKDRVEIGVLGNHGFLDRYKAAFDLATETFTIS